MITRPPWHLRKCHRQTDDSRTTIHFRNGWGVFSDSEAFGDPESDARIICAAPQMLETLKIVARVISDADNPITDTLWASDCETLLDAVMDAISSAEPPEPQP